MKTQNFYNATDFSNMADLNIYQTASEFRKIIDQMDEHKVKPYNIVVNGATGSSVSATDPYTEEARNLVSFVSSNYLNLNTHPSIKHAVIDITHKYGSGTCTTPLIGGFEDIHQQLEQSIANMHKQEDAILFSSGFAANVGVVQSLFNKSDFVIVDMFVHASIYDGLSSTNFKICKHNDPEYLELILKNNLGKYRNIAMIIDSVYSQDGDISPLAEISDVLKRYGAYLIVDEAHGVGVFGKDGSGLCCHLGIEDKVDLITGTLSKGIAAMGGYITGCHALINYIRHYARPAIFSASLTPQIAAGAMQAIHIMKSEHRHIEKLWVNVNYAKGRLSELGYALGNSDSPIIPIMVKDDKKVLFIARSLFEKGFYIIPTVYPAVKLGNSRLRMNISSGHTKEQLDAFCLALEEVNSEIPFK
ncbi:MAG: aminotransferase class I/II-fold pyridoxal phosphate-dependent enzyme [Mangrovibacterium sp.]